MTAETKSVHITPVAGNVFADLGFEPEEAAALKAESHRIIAEKLVKEGRVGSVLITNSTSIDTKKKAP